MLTRRSDWSGVFTVMVTPFTEQRALDESAMRRLVNLLIHEKSDGLVVAGSTGEWQALSDDERTTVFRIVAEENRGRVSLIAGTSALNTPTVVKLTASAQKLGFDGAMILPPPYVMPTQREVVDFFKSIDAVGLPVMLYNNPVRTGVNLDAKMLDRLLEFSTVVSLKDSNKDLSQVSATLRAHGETLAVFTGMETYAVPVLQRGGVGVVAMGPNMLGSAAVQFIHAIRKGMTDQEIAQLRNTDMLYEAMYGWGLNPYVVIKAVMRIVGRPGGWPRPPLADVTSDNTKMLTALIERIRAKQLA
jgi:4-hydroxy-tetrahydrodipicolinate synthase